MAGKMLKLSHLSPIEDNLYGFKTNDNYCYSVFGNQEVIRL